MKQSFEKEYRVFLADDRGNREFRQGELFDKYRQLDISANDMAQIMKAVDSETHAKTSKLESYTMVYADGRLDKAEKKLFESYNLELDADLSKVHKVDFNEELSTFDNCDQKTKVSVFFDLYAIALIDKEYPEEEKILVDIMQKRLEITDAKMQEMRDGVATLVAAYDTLRKIVES